MDIKEIHELIRLVAETGVAQVKVKIEDFELKIKGNVPESVQVLQQPIYHQGMEVPKSLPPIPLDTAKQEAPPTEENQYLTITSPMIGTFYRKPSPDKDAFVQVGDTVSVGSVVCVIEAMKLFNQIESEVAGKIVKILVEDASPVEYNQPLFLVEPV